MPSSTSSSSPGSGAARKALLALAGAFLALNAAVIALWQGLPFSHVSEERYLAVVIDHVAMLEESKGEEGRIVLVGGSGVAFSISAQALGQTLDRPVFNGGIQVGIGYRNLIDLYSRHLDPENDLIVLLPELELLADDARYTETWCDAIFLRKALGDLFGQPRCMPHIAYRTYQEVRHHLAGTTMSDPVYRRSAFNAVGDVTSHLEIERRSPDFTDYVLPDISEAKLARFETYVHERLIERGFDVLYIPAAMPMVACDSAPEERAAMVARLSKLSTVAVEPADYRDFCLEPRLFFDGAGHLNRDGRAGQTERVRETLKAALER